jgi:hypothetical protein
MAGRATAGSGHRVPRHELTHGLLAGHLPGGAVAHERRLLVDADHDRAAGMPGGEPLEGAVPAGHPVEVGDDGHAPHEAEPVGLAVGHGALAAQARPAGGERHGTRRAARQRSPAVPGLDDGVPHAASPQGLGQVVGITAREVDEADVAHQAGELGALGVGARAHGHRDRLDTHALVVPAAEVEPVRYAGIALECSGRREERSPGRTSPQELGVDRLHDGEELAAAHERHRPRTCHRPLRRCRAHVGPRLPGPYRAR